MIDADKEKEILIKQIEEANEVVKQAKAQYYLTHFYEFNQDIISWPDIYEPLHRRVCEFVEKNTKLKNLLLLLPRNSFKSSIVTIGYTLWRIVQNPKERILIANATYPMACQFLSQVKDHLTKNEKFIDLFGSFAADADNWREDKITVAREKSYEQKEPTVVAFGMGSNLTGSHYSLAILDDMVNDQNIGTREQIDKVINFYKNVLDLVDPDENGKKQVIIIGTTWHQSDLYSWIQDPETGILNDFEILKLPAYTGEWGKGELLFPPRLTWDFLAGLKRQQGSSHFCTPAESPVIMGDLSVKKIVDIKQGDEICGWSESKEATASLKIAKVKKKFKYLAEVVEMKMESGNIVRCTTEHQWFTGRGYTDGCHKRYKPAKVGSRLMFIFNPVVPKLTKEQQQLAYWLGGFFDGEGSCCKGYNSIVFSQSRFANPLLWKKMQEVCDKLKFPHKTWEKIYNKKNPRVRFGYKGMMWLNGGKQGKMDFLNLCKPFKSERVLDTVYGKENFVQKQDKVVSIKSIGKKEVYALETETGNYIVWGYGSSNSAQYLLDPVPLEDAVFKFKFKYYEPTDITGLNLNKFITVDPAISEKKEADYSAMICVGVDKNNDWYILDVWRDKVQPKRLLDQIFYWDEKWKPMAVGIESVSFQKALQYFAYEEMKRKNHFIPIKELKHTDQSKDQRIRALEPRYETGSIFHNKDLAMNDNLEDELRRFNKGKNDDLIDALASQLELAFPPTSTEERKKRHYNHYPA